MPLNEFESKDELQHIKSARVFFTTAMMVSFMFKSTFQGQICRVKMLAGYKNPIRVSEANNSQ